MIEVKVSDQPYIYIPVDLSKQLDLAEGDRVELTRSGNLITLHKSNNVHRPLRALAGIVKSSRPKGSVDVEDYMTRRGYESYDGSTDS